LLLSCNKHGHVLEISFPSRTFAVAQMIDDTRPDPDVKLGLEYWATQPASYDGVLGRRRPYS
jgi:hypothetical protein